MKLLIQRTIEDLTDEADLDILTADQLFTPAENEDVSDIPTNVYENDDHYRMELMCPGFEIDDFIIRLDDNGNLLVKAESNEKQNEDEDILRSEFKSSYAFSRAFQIPADAATDEIDAYYDNGILTLLIPKKEEVGAKSSIKIEIK